MATSDSTPGPVRRSAVTPLRPQTDRSLTSLAPTSPLGYVVALATGFSLGTGLLVATTFAFGVRAFAALVRVVTASSAALLAPMLYDHSTVQFGLPAEQYAGAYEAGPMLVDTFPGALVVAGLNTLNAPRQSHAAYTARILNAGGSQ